MNPSRHQTEATDVTTPTPEQPQAASAEGALRHALSNGITAFLFAATGPLAILITVGRSGGLSQADIASWIFGAYGLGGLLTLWMCWRYRQPLGLAWTIPGALLLPPALDHLSFAEVIGAYWVTGLLITVLGASGVVSRVMRRVPMPIVMGMVAGVFLPLGVRVITAFTDLPVVATITLATFVLFTVLPTLGRRVPPVLAALLAGVLAALLLGAMQPLGPSTGLLATPRLYTPAFSVQALLELVVPMAVTVLAIQNAQGFAVLQQAGHSAPVRAVTVACGLGSLPFAAVGSVPTCLTGPVNGILVASGERGTHWLGGLVFGVIMVLFGLFAPAATRLALALPMSLIGLLGGLAMLRVLQGAFQSAFRGRCPLGAMVAFVVTVANVPILNIGAPFWGLVFAFAASALLERDDLREAMHGR
ncbi:benzoate/H(+) symporter BenE family transporter [Immundisolibacter sp.]|uniref:benzoate/H(+) symporter BenE family transporter n=1 Tax=Immundisolibacter sp. TaxID=1934948 RepID=UPI0035661681